MAETAPAAAQAADNPHVLDLYKLAVEMADRLYLAFVRSIPAAMRIWSL